MSDAGQANPPVQVRRLSSTPYEKVWGTTHTEPWYRNPEHRRIGEVWFKASDETALLVKLLFTSERLSVQVHPGDEYARTHEDSPGKTEMWHILRAEPGAEIAGSLRVSLSREELRDACLSGDVLDLLDWIPAREGDTFFLPAGTIHAIGGGIVACEVQQVSDVTYRLFDYGRGRELHLDRGLAVSKLEPSSPRAKPVKLTGGRELLAESSYFRTERLEVHGAAPCEGGAKNTIYVALRGEGSIAGLPFEPGDGFEVPSASLRFEITSPDAAFLITTQP